MRIKQFSRQKPCYYCGAPPPSGREHVPPVMMFDGFDCDSITVPSCDLHNTRKSIGDRGIVTALILSVSQMYKNREKLNVILTPNVIRAIQLVEPYFHQAVNEVELRPLLSDPPEGLDIPLPYLQSTAYIPQWIKQITAALVWSAIGFHDKETDWDSSVPWSHGYLPASGNPINSAEVAAELAKNRELDQELEQMKWHSGWSAIPRNYPEDIYSFELSFVAEPERWEGMNIIFRHRFYNSTSVWHNWLKASPKTLLTLKEVVDY